MDEKEILTEAGVTYKLVLLGDWGAGKSNLLLKYTDGTFSDEHATTIGVDFKIKKLTINNQPIKLKICDTAGHERFRVVTSSYYRAVHAALLCCDLSSKEGFSNAMQWVDEIKRYAPSEATVFLVGTKSDLPQQLDESQITEFCKKDQIHFWKTSAKTGENVENLFTDAANSIAERLAKSKSTLRQNSSKEEGKTKKGGGKKCFH